MDSMTFGVATAISIAAVVTAFTYLIDAGHHHSSLNFLWFNSKISNTGEQAKTYTAYHDLGGGSAELRAAETTSMVDKYYNMVTDMYLWGWGESFHFAPRYATETHAASLVRHEHYLAGATEAVPGDVVLDVGCGVGGPARNIARVLDTKIVGITINEYQVQRGNELSREANVGPEKESGASVELVQGNFMELPFEKGSFDAAYAIEATCHASDRLGVYKEVFDSLKPGAVFAVYEWCVTDNYDPSNPRHVELKQEIELGNALPDILSTREVVKTMEKAGFEVEADEDLALRGPEPWFGIAQNKWSGWENLKTHPIAMEVTNYIIGFFEAIFLIPKGTCEMQRNLVTGLIALRDAGEEGIFTPCFYVKARKPLK